MKNRNKIVFIIALVIIIAILMAGSLRQGESQTVKVQIKKVERGDLYHKVSGPGNIQPKSAIRLSANVSARIEKLAVEEGDFVSKNQILVQLDRTKLQAALVQARANLNSAKITVDKQKYNKDLKYSEYGRKKKLYEKGLLSEEQIEDSETQYKLSEAAFREARDQVVHAQGYLDQALDDLEKTTLRSPLDGIVTRINKKEGEIALGSQFQEDVILIISNFNHLEAVIKVDENDVIKISKGDSSVIQIDALPDTLFNGCVSEIAHISSTSGIGAQDEIVSFNVKITINDVVAGARFGMSANVDIITDIRKDVVKVPIQAITIRKKDDIDFALMPENSTDVKIDTTIESIDKMEEIAFVVKGNQVKMRRLETGIVGEIDIEICEGLEQGEQVVIGNYRALSRELKHNSKVKIK